MNTDALETATRLVTVLSVVQKPKLKKQKVVAVSTMPMEGRILAAIGKAAIKLSLLKQATGNRMLLMLLLLLHLPLAAAGRRRVTARASSFRVISPKAFCPRHNTYHNHGLERLFIVHESML